MATVGSLVVNLLGNTQQFRAEFGAVPGIIRGVTSSALSLIGIGGGLAGLGRGIQLAAEAERAHVAFEVMTGSATKAKQILGDLRAFADKSPFSLAGITEAGKLLLNFGTAADQVLPTVKMLADIAGGDEQKLHSLALAFGQSASAGRLMGQDLNQMINAGFNPLVEIAARTGESMAALKARMEAGAISTAEVTQAFKDATSEGGRFYGMTEKQSETLAGLWSTFRDTIDGVLRDVGLQLMQTFDLRAILANGIRDLQGWSEWLKKVANDLIIGVSVIGGFVAGIMSIRVALFAAAQAAAVFRALSGPAGWAQLVAGMLGAAVAIDTLNGYLDSSISKMEGVSASAGKASTAIASIGKSDSGTALAQELQQLQAIRNELKKTDLAPNYKKKLQEREASSVSKIELMTSVPGGPKALSTIELLHQQIRDLRQAGGDEINLIPGIEDRIGEISGATEKIRALRDEISGVSKDDLEAQKLSEKGATNEQVAEFMQLSAQAKAMKDLREARERVVRQTETPSEKFDKQIEELHKLKSQNFIDDETFEKGKKLAAEDLAKSEKDDKETTAERKRDQPLEAIFAKSKESQLAILRGIQNSDGPNKKLESITERVAKATEKGNQLLEKLAAKDAQHEEIVVMEYP